MNTLDFSQGSKGSLTLGNIQFQNLQRSRKMFRQH